MLKRGENRLVCSQSSTKVRRTEVLSTMPYTNVSKVFSAANGSNLCRSNDQLCDITNDCSLLQFRIISQVYSNRPSANNKPSRGVWGKDFHFHRNVFLIFAHKDPAFLQLKPVACIFIRSTLLLSWSLVTWRRGTLCDRAKFRSFTAKPMTSSSQKGDASCPLQRTRRARLALCVPSDRFGCTEMR